MVVVDLLQVGRQLVGRGYSAESGGSKEDGRAHIDGRLGYLVYGNAQEEMLR